MPKGNLNTAFVNKYSLLTWRSSLGRSSYLQRRYMLIKVKENMLTEHFLILKILGILIAIAYTIFRFQVILEIISGFKKWKKDKNNKYDRDLKNKIGDYLSEYNLNEVAENDNTIDHMFVKPPVLHLLKLVELESSFTIYFSDKGGNISDIKN